MGEEAGVEAGAETAVDHPDHVPVEPGRDARLVVVGGLEDTLVFDEVETDQDAVPLAQPGAQSYKEFSALLGGEVADGAPEKGDDPCVVRWASEQPPQRVVEVAYKTLDLEPRVLGTSLSPLPLSALSLTSSGT